jgi:hypothetical protein
MEYPEDRFLSYLTQEYPGLSINYEYEILSKEYKAKVETIRKEAIKIRFFRLKRTFQFSTISLTKRWTCCFPFD